MASSELGRGFRTCMGQAMAAESDLGGRRRRASKERDAGPCQGEIGTGAAGRLPKVNATVVSGDCFDPNLTPCASSRLAATQSRQRHPRRRIMVFPWGSGVQALPNPGRCVEQSP